MNEAMLKLDRDKRTFSLLDTPTLADVSITERYDLQEFIFNSSEEFFKEIGQELFLLGKEVEPSKNVQDRIDLLAVDKEGTCVVVELKRGNHKLHMLQAISYTAMLSQWDPDDFLQLLGDDQQETLLDFLEVDRRCCTARSKLLTSLCRWQSHPAQYVSGIPSAVILLSISHPIRCSTRCLANVRVRISGPMIAL